jgi:hypothetical protein
MSKNATLTATDVSLEGSSESPCQHFFTWLQCIHLIEITLSCAAASLGR